MDRPVIEFDSSGIPQTIRSAFANWQATGKLSDNAASGKCPPVGQFAFKSHGGTLARGANIDALLEGANKWLSISPGGAGGLAQVAVNFFEDDGDMRISVGGYYYLDPANEKDALPATRVCV